MSEPIVIDSTLGGGSMATAYSADMRLRVIGRVESGASRREAAEHYEVSPSTAVIWVKCFRETGRRAANLIRRGDRTQLLAMIGGAAALGWLLARQNTQASLRDITPSG
jgi:hypothetical protein